MDLHSINTTLLTEYIDGFNKIHVNNGDELVELLDYLRDIGYKIGFHYSVRSEYEYISLGRIHRDEIHASLDRNGIKHPGCRTIEYADICSIFPRWDQSISAEEIMGLFQ